MNPQKHNLQEMTFMIEEVKEEVAKSMIFKKLRLIGTLKFKREVEVEVQRNEKQKKRNTESKDQNHRAKIKL